MFLTVSNYLRLSKKQYQIIDTLCFLSKNMFNVGLYSINTHYSTSKEFLSYEENYHCCKENENYSLLHSDNAQQTLKVVSRSLNSFLGLLKQKKKGNYSAKVNYPHYLRKNGRFPLIYPVRRSMIKNDYVVLGMSRQVNLSALKDGASYFIDTGYYEEFS